MEREIKPIQPISKSSAVGKVRAIRLYHRPRYRSKLKPNLFQVQPEIKSVTNGDEHARQSDNMVEKLGTRVDYKI